MAEAIEKFKLRASEEGRADLNAITERDRAAADQRRADSFRLIAEFKEAVGPVLETFFSASPQLEASARTLTCSADQSQKLYVEVAAALEEASANVQRVAVRDRQNDGDDCGSRLAGRASSMAHQAVRNAELSERRGPQPRRSGLGVWSN